MDSFDQPTTKISSNWRATVRSDSNDSPIEAPHAANSSPRRPASGRDLAAQAVHHAGQKSASGSTKWSWSTILATKFLLAPNFICLLKKFSASVCRRILKSGYFRRASALRARVHGSSRKFITAARFPMWQQRRISPMNIRDCFIVIQRESYSFKYI